MCDNKNYKFLKMWYVANTIINHNQQRQKMQFLPENSEYQLPPSTTPPSFFDPHV